MLLPFPRRLLTLVSAALLIGLPAPTTAGAAAANPVEPSGQTRTEELALAWFDLDESRPARAARRAAALLERDPTDATAHRVYIRAWSRMHGRPLLSEQYRSWLEEEPDSPLRRITQAIALLEQGPLTAAACEEVERLLDPLPEDPELRYEALRALRSAHRGDCPGDAEADLERLFELRGQTPAGEAWILRRMIERGPVDAELRAIIRHFFEASPWFVDSAGRLWSDEAAGPALRAARQDALRSAREWVLDDRVSVVAAAVDVLDAAGREKEAKAGGERLTSLDPVRERSLRLDLADELDDDILLARKMVSSEAGLEKLEELSGQCPANGPVRAVLEMARHHQLGRLGRDAEALEALRLAWRADPGDPDLANSFAWSAALLGEHLDEALVAADAAIGAAEQQVYDRTEVSWLDGYGAWRERRIRSLAAVSDTRAWVLHGLGRHDEAAREMRHTLRLSDQADFHLRMGLIYVALGRNAVAAEHLARGLAAGPTGEADFAEQARSALEELAAEQGWWHPGGLDGYLAVRAAVLRAEQEQEETKVDVQEAPHPLIGQLFPDLELKKSARKKKKISDYDGIRVVDLWATWCGPCVAGLPHLEEVASTHAGRGVTVLAVSVDQEMGDVEAMFVGVESTSYELLWGGWDVMDEARINGVPTVFILDGDGVVREVIMGYHEGDRRIDEALDALLGEPAAGSDGGPT